MPLHLGTSGWQYRDWRERFYPKGLPQRRWLEHYAAEFATVEVNNSFYRLPPRATFEKWAAETPPEFMVAPKISRFLSHMKKLKEPAEPVERFSNAALGLGAKLGPALLQLPGNFPAQPARLDETLSLFGPGFRIAVELRHPSWFSDEVRAILERHGAALVWTDRLERMLEPPWRTANWGYVRWHEGMAEPRPCYREETLAEWAQRIAETWPDSKDVWAYFNNDPGGCAITDARVFRRLWAELGRSEARPVAASRPA